MRNSNKVLLIGLVVVTLGLSAILVNARTQIKNESVMPIGNNVAKISLVDDGRVENNLSTITKVLPAFNAIRIDGVGSFVIHSGKDPQLQATASPQLLAAFTVGVNQQVLVIKVKDGLDKKFMNRIKFDITVPQLTALDINGVTQVLVRDIQGDKFDLKIDGITHGEFIGNVNELQLDIDGTVDLEAQKLKAQKVTLKSDGITHVIVTATQFLKINADGLGDIRYYGNPAQVEKNVLGLVHVEDVGGK